jgi:hypothetical protein
VHANRERTPLTFYAAFGALNDHDALGKARILMAPASESDVLQRVADERAWETSFGTTTRQQLPG